MSSRERRAGPGPIERQCQGMKWTEVRDAGLLGPLIAETGYGYKRLAATFGWAASQWLRQACQAVVGKGEQPVQFPVVLETLPEVADVTHIPSELGNHVYRYLHNNAAAQTTVLALAEKFDERPSDVRAALEEIKQSGYCVDMREHDDLGEVARLARNEPQQARRVVPLPWCDAEVVVGVVTDTHLANTFAAEYELEIAYDRFQAEGITQVLHAGDMTDGSGHYGYPGHVNEVRDECYTPRQACAYTIDHYPRREGITTLCIESQKSHAGWDLQREGFDHGNSVEHGFSSLKRTPRGTEVHFKEGREDIRFLGYDAATLTLGPENNTQIALLHPGGGSSYALSYRPQKWSEALEGGSKPHIAILGHYHKGCYIRPRNIHVLSAECMEWQTPFMARNCIAAHVGFAILRLGLNNDGTVREWKPEWFPFFLNDRTVFDMGRGEFDIIE